MNYEFRTMKTPILFCISFRYQSFANRFVLYVFLFSLAFTRLCCSAILVGDLLRQNSLRIRKSTLYILLTCLERAHSHLNTHASRTVISTPPPSMSSILLLTLRPCLLYSYNSISRIRSDLLLS